MSKNMASWEGKKTVFDISLEKLQDAVQRKSHIFVRTLVKNFNNIFNNIFKQGRHNNYRTTFQQK